MTNREIDWLIAEKVMGYEYRPGWGFYTDDRKVCETSTFKPSTDLNHCREAEMRLKEENPGNFASYGVRLADSVRGGRSWSYVTYTDVATSDARTRCLCMLQALGIQVG